MDIKEFRKLVVNLSPEMTDEQYWDAVSDYSLEVLRKRAEEKRAGLRK